MCGHTGIDLLIADIPEGLPVPNVSSPSTAIPDWNALPSGFVESIFIFAETFLHDDAALLLFHCDDPNIHNEVVEWAQEYGFKVHRDWWGVNELRLASPRNPVTTVHIASTFCSPMF